MTDRRPGEDLERVPDRPAGARAPVPRQGVAGEEAILGLQELAGNRAVADLLGGESAPRPAGSAGLRLRDALRVARRPVQPAVQRQGLLDPEDWKELGPGGGSWEEEGSGPPAESWEKGKSTGEKWGGLGPGGGSWEEEGSGPPAESWEKGKGTTGEKWGGLGPGEKSQEKGGGAAGGMLAVGSAGPAVVRLQTLLAGAGFAVSADGFFGPRTRAAVIAFQSSRGLAPDGIVGPKTWAALEGSSPATSSAGSAGLAATGEMELVEPGGPAMEKVGSAGGGEAMLPEPGGWKGGGGPEAGFPGSETPNWKESKEVSLLAREEPAADEGAPPGRP